MSLLYSIPVIGAVALAFGNIVQRSILKKRKIKIGVYQSAVFLGIVLVMIPFLFFFWKFELQALHLKNLIFLALIVIFSLIANRLSFYSMKWEKISNIESAKILEPLFVILLAILFSFIFDTALYERNLNVIIPAIIAAIALVFSHIKKHHLQFNKYFIATIFSSLFFALELVTSRLILDYYSPVTFYFIRCLLIVIISFIMFKPKLNKLSTKLRLEIIGAGAIFVIYRFILYYGYLGLGIVFTTLILMLGPIFLYLFAWKFLKDKPNWKNSVASGIIIVSVLYAIVS